MEVYYLHSWSDVNVYQMHCSSFVCIFLFPADSAVYVRENQTRPDLPSPPPAAPNQINHASLCGTRSQSPAPCAAIDTLRI